MEVLDGELMDDLTFNHDGLDLLVPREVYKYFSKYKCLVCGSKLSEDPIGIREPDRYTAFADCAEDALHFEVSVSWKDPKKIQLNHIEVEFSYEDRQYKIKQRHKNKKIVNEITSNRLDENGIISNDSNEFFEEFEGSIFNFKKFSPKQFADRIKMLIVFT